MTSNTRPWHPIPIQDRGEPLLDLPPQLLRLVPHPYQALGAPYGEGRSPFRLRRGVIDRLLLANARLGEQRPGWRLAIFDAWRPVAVQRFMVAHAIAAECRSRGLDPAQASAERAEVEREVGRFWAPPSLDPATPLPTAPAPRWISPWLTPMVPWRWAGRLMRSVRFPNLTITWARRQWTARAPPPPGTADAGSWRR